MQLRAARDVTQHASYTWASVVGVLTWKVDGSAPHANNLRSEKQPNQRYEPAPSLAPSPSPPPDGPHGTLLTTMIPSMLSGPPASPTDDPSADTHADVAEGFGGRSEVVKVRSMSPAPVFPLIVRDRQRWSVSSSVSRCSRSCSACYSGAHAYTHALQFNIDDRVHL